jgi:hypothetical protein
MIGNVAIVNQPLRKCYSIEAFPHQKEIERKKERKRKEKKEIKVGRWLY